MNTEISPAPTSEGQKQPRVGAVVVLNRNGAPTVTDITAKLRKLFPELAPAEDLVHEDEGVGFYLQESMVMILTRTGAVPLTAADETTIAKPLSAAVLESQQAHLAIAAVNRDPVSGAIAATKVVAAIVASCPHAIAVYWPAARLWTAPRVFLDAALRLSRPPVNLWIDIRVWPIAGNCHAGFTRGLRALGCKEFEVRASPESAKALRDRLRALCVYVLMHGAIIRDGNTVGLDADERIQVLLCRSVHGLQDTVLRLDYPEDFRPKRPWWKLI